MNRLFTARISTLGLILGALAVGLLACRPSDPTAGSAHADASPCEQLAASEHGLPETTLVSSQLVAAGELVLPSKDDPVTDLPALCRVSGRIDPEIQFEVWLPKDNWNGKFQSVGNGGMAGTVSYRGLVAALGRGYAAASTDTGHASSGQPFDASWASGRPDLVADFGHRALHLTTVAAKRITELYYGAPPTHSYYVGCSKGGQQGMMEAQRYPQDFDGLLVGNPANDWTRFYAGAHLWYALATLADEESYIPPDKVKLLGDAVNQACDALDGIADGVLDDPRKCKFDPATLQCGDNSSTQDCLTAPQVEAVRKIWSGARNEAGEVVFPGLVPGGEASPGGWATWVTGPEPFRSLHWLAGEGFFRHIVFDDPNWDFQDFDYDRDLEAAIAKVGPMLDAADPDLRPFRDRGGKLLLYHGWSDADISPLATIDYYEKVVAVIGEGREAESSLSETQEFFRLFMVPGMGHCAGGPGADSFDGLGALERWVEKGEAPDRIEASRRVDGEVQWTRPLCPYPQVARWTGSGSTDDADNFRCVDSE